MAQPVLYFLIVGAEDHPIFEADLTAKSTDASGREVSRRRLSKALALLLLLLLLLLPLA